MWWRRGTRHAPGGLRVSTDPYRGNLAVYRRCVTGLVDDEVEEREQSEHVDEGGVEPVVIDRFVIADFVKSLDWEELWVVCQCEQDRWTTDLDLRQPRTAGQHRRR